MTGSGGALWPYLFIAIAGFAATDFWRYLGVFASVRIDEESEILRWVRAVSTALVAGLVARLVVFPIGDLASAATWARLGAVGIGVAVYSGLRRNMLAGILAGEVVLLVAMWLEG